MQQYSTEWRRQSYLRAIGITVWIRRESGQEVNNKAADGRPHHPSVEETLSGFIHESGNDEPITPIQTQQFEPDQQAPAAITGYGELDWARLEEVISSCTACKLHTSRSQAITGAGKRDADLMVIGDAPCTESDRKKTAFAGPAARLLNNMLSAIKIDNNSVYYTNAVKCRTPAGRIPNDAELESCRPYLMRQIELIQPRAILLLGKTAAQSILQQNIPLSRFRGQIHTLPDLNIPVVVSYHPRYLLLQKADKGKAWNDLKLLCELHNEK